MDMNYNGLPYRMLHGITRVISSINWDWGRKMLGGKYQVTDAEKDYIRDLLRIQPCFILIENRSFLSGYLVRMLSWLTTGKWVKYTHVLMNFDVGLGSHPDGFLLIESTNSGVHFSTFDHVFECDNVCLTTVDLTHFEWLQVRMGLAKQLGKSYDDWFDLQDNTHVTCVEMCWDALDELDNRDEVFPTFVQKIARYNQINPEDFRDSDEIILIYETKH